jgi:hypothetical protein
MGRDARLPGFEYPPCSSRATSFLGGSRASDEQTREGLCLNVLLDRTFDRGLKLTGDRFRTASLRARSDGELAYDRERIFVG